jgi:hypothetical protein
MRWVIGVSLAAAIGGGAYAFGRTSNRPAQAREVPAPSANVAGLESEVAELRQEVGLLAAQRLAPQAAPPEPPPPPLARSTAPKERVEEAAKHEAEQKRYLDDLAKNEPRDRSWAPGYEQQVRAAVQAATDGKQGTSLDSVSCHTSLCRLTASHETAAAQHEFWSEFKMHLPPMAAAHVVVTDGKDGPLATTVDFIREGYSVPDMP